MKIKARTITCQNSEILITSEDVEAKYYKIYYKGKELRDVTALIRVIKNE